MDYPPKEEQRVLRGSKVASSSEPSRTNQHRRCPSICRRYAGISPIKPSGPIFSSDLRRGRNSSSGARRRLSGSIIQLLPTSSLTATRSALRVVLEALSDKTASTRSPDVTHPVMATEPAIRVNATATLGAGTTKRDAITLRPPWSYPARQNQHPSLGAHADHLQERLLGRNSARPKACQGLLRAKRLFHLIHQGMCRLGRS